LDATIVGDSATAVADGATTVGTARRLSGVSEFCQGAHGALPCRVSGPCAFRERRRCRPDPARSTARIHSMVSARIAETRAVHEKVGRLGGPVVRRKTHRPRPRGAAVQCPPPPEFVLSCNWQQGVQWPAATADDGSSDFGALRATTVGDGL